MLILQHLLYNYKKEVVTKKLNIYGKNWFTFSLGFKFETLNTTFRIAIVYTGELFSGMEIASTKQVLRHIGLTILKKKMINK